METYWNETPVCKKKWCHSGLYQLPVPTHKSIPCRFCFFAVGGSEKTINYRIVLVAAKVTAEPLLALAVPEEI